jgi:hypothetical protein
MGGQPADPVLACLRRIDAKLDRLIDDEQDLGTGSCLSKARSRHCNPR